jgi:hypothetical protein
MYDSLADFLRTFSTDQPLIWAFLVLAVVAATSLALYFFWELVLRLLFSGLSSFKRNSTGRE